MSRSLLASVVVTLASLLAACGSSSSTEKLGPPAALVFTASPQNAVAGQPLSDIEVHVVDSHGKTVTTSLASITLSIASGPSGAALEGLNQLGASAGASIFTGLLIKKAGTYTLSASAGGVPTVTSAPFTIAAAAASTGSFVDQPNNIAIGAHFAKPVTVALFDTYGNPATTSNATVGVTLANNPSGATLLGTTSVAAANGIATFADLSVDKPGLGYTLTAWVPNAPASAPSSAFDAHAATNFVYVDPPTGAKLRLVKNAASKNGTIALDLVTTVPITAYALAMNLPMDRTRVAPNPTLMIPGSGLSLGTNPVAAAAGLPTSGPRAGVLAVGLTQKAAGSGAVTTDTAIPAGTTLFTVQIDVGGSGLGGTVFDGSALGPAFRAAMLDKDGNTVVTSADFAIGTLSLE